MSSWCDEQALQADERALHAEQMVRELRQLLRDILREGEKGNAGECVCIAELALDYIRANGTY